MSLNTAHTNGGVSIYLGEFILLYCDNVTLEWLGQAGSAFKGTKNGKIHLTSHRLIFINNSRTNQMRSFSFPYITLSEIGIEQPVFGANNIKAKVRAQPNGNWEGEAIFKVKFKHGGAIEFGRALHEVSRLATRGMDRSAPLPPYEPPHPDRYNAPPSAYTPPPQIVVIIFCPLDVFPDRPPVDDVYMSNARPAYPGVTATYGGGGYAPPGGGNTQAVAPYQGGYPTYGGYRGQPAGHPPPSYSPTQGAYSEANSQPPQQDRSPPSGGHRLGGGNNPPPYNRDVPGGRRRRDRRDRYGCAIM